MYSIFQQYKQVTVIFQLLCCGGKDVTRVAETFIQLDYYG